MAGGLSLPVRTPRLEVRALVASDAEAMAAYRSLPDVCRYVPFEPMTAATVRHRIEAGWATVSLRDDGDVAILGAALDGVVVGDLMLRLSSRTNGVGELGYVFHPDVGGRGLATEAAHAVLHLGFDQLGLRRMTARLDAANVASRRLLERLGLRCEAHLVEHEWFKGRLADELDFAMLRREWDAQHAEADPSVGRLCPAPRG